MIRNSQKTSSVGGVNYNSPQLAKIKQSTDKNKNGGCMVWLVNSNTDENDPSNWISVGSCSPFQGLTPRKKVSSSNTQSESGAQKSYGMFTGPPDEDNLVMVQFANGQPDKGFWIGAVMPPGYNAGMLGGKAGVENGKGGTGTEMNPFTQQLQVPDKMPRRPAQEENNAAVESQETTGEDAQSDAGPMRSEQPDSMGITSKGGHQIVMDDKNGLLRIRTANAAQIVISPSGIFMINSSGNGWVRMGNGGDVDLFSSVSVNLFGGGDINMKAGGNLNLEAGGDINSKAGGTNAVEGGTISLHAGTILSAKITGEISYADSAGMSPPGPAIKVGDPSTAAGSVSRTPSRGGGAST